MRIIGGKFKGTNILDMSNDDDRVIWNENLNDALNDFYLNHFQIV